MWLPILMIPEALQAEIPLPHPKNAQHTDHSRGGRKGKDLSKMLNYLFYSDLLAQNIVEDLRIGLAAC